MSRHEWVRRHHGSGSKALDIAVHASHVVGMPVEQALIDELIAYATQPRFVCSHARHRATPFAAGNEGRELRRTTVVDMRA